ncbi:MAG TPA: response regulator [Candidatus Anammoximicrobium sp.]|mgnify:CR=1 FL=1|nr:response regulator [Candidatus Anammoximicrobium sp.]HPM80327.1 response regulator [Candidatus Anammoximicrobium sp.]
MTSSDALIAVIEDEPPIRRFLRASLSVEGFRVAEAATAKDGLRLITQERPALVLLDLGLPDADGLTIIEQVRQWSTMPIIILSARGEEQSKVEALDAGADDYLSKPFGVGELLARIRVALRHAARISDAGVETTVFRFGRIRGDLAERRVFVNDEEVKLTKLEFDLLATLVRNAGKVLTHRYLLKEVWGPYAVDEPHYVRVFMANLRKKLEPDPSRPEYLLTEQGVGYRLKGD